MGRSRKASQIAAVLAAVGLALTSAALDPDGARAQLRDPPLGWDMWDPGWTRRDVWQGEDQHVPSRVARHRAFTKDGVPEPYRGASNPLTRTPEAVRKGAALYAENCASCHGESGMGRGEAGLALYPSPALLAHMIRMPDAVDAYLLWAISEGGAPFGTDMPAFEDELSDEELWQIITYMRAGFPATDQADQAGGE